MATLGSTCLTCMDNGIEAEGCAGINNSSTCPEPFASSPRSIILGVSQGLFTIPAFFIVFQEALEASIICAVLYGIIMKRNRPELKKYVWYGIVVGLGVTLAALIVLLVAISTLAEGAGVKQRMILQGSLSICAAVLLAHLALTIGNLLNIQDKIRSRVQSEVEQKDGGVRWKTVFFLSFTAIAREGVSKRLCSSASNQTSN